CTATLASGASCDLVVMFNPSGSGAQASIIGLGYNDGAGGASVATQGVTGTVINGPSLRIMDWDNWMPPPNPSPYDYGTWGIPSDHTFTVMNVGNQTAFSVANGGGLGAGFAYAGGTYPGSGGNCGTSLASGATCTIVVRFTPSGSGAR